MQHSSFKGSSTLREVISNTKDVFTKRDAAQFAGHTGLFLSSYFRHFISFSHWLSEMKIFEVFVKTETSFARIWCGWPVWRDMSPANTVSVLTNHPWRVFLHLVLRRRALFATSSLTCQKWAGGWLGQPPCRASAHYTRVLSGTILKLKIGKF